MGLIRPLLAIAIFVSATGCTNSSESGSGVSSTITSECESAPLAQFRLGGVTYVARQSADTVVKADLGAVLGTQDGGIPEGLLRCELVQLADGQGSLARGAHVYAIHGVEPSVAIAAEVGTEYMKLYPS
jgi:hypothetical protein